MPSCKVFNSTPAANNHTGVVINMEEGYLVIFFSQNEENRVEEIQYFYDEVYIHSSSNLKNEIVIN